MTIDHSPITTLNCNGTLLDLSKPLVMGILNITPDSFYDGSRVEDITTLIERAGAMLEEGADILDLGGQTTRPGSERISATEELRRVIPALEAVHDKFPSAILSVDTFNSSVAKEAIKAGASIINDISAGALDDHMIRTVAESGLPYVLMHMKGDPKTMQQQAAYENVTREVLDFFIEKIDVLIKAGINDIIIDPGFGFAKTIEHNFQLLKDLSVFKILEKPILLGLSRKSTIYKTLGVTANEALNGTTVLNTIGLMNGANILRVHDVREAKEAITLFTKLPSADSSL